MKQSPGLLVVSTVLLMVVVSGLGAVLMVAKSASTSINDYW
ncbi:MAG: hypothetical protein JWP57_4315 [Spirosoma sp.]|nr:hypothetical protein [Spirosoma sp.]